MPASAQLGLYFYSFKTMTSSLAWKPEREQPDNGAPALGISPDGRYLVICMMDQPLVYIMLVQNVRL